MTVSKNIGKYGPFKLNRRFAFSNFDTWGSAHNRGFEACIEAARGESCVFDIGAHIGLVSLPLSHSIADGGSIYAFEPAIANGLFLKQHMKLNNIKNIEVITDLLGDVEKESVEFFESAGDSGMNTIASSGYRRGYSSTIKRQITLDKFCEDRQLAPQLIKIDTEGAEVGILKGGRNILRQHRPIIYLSVHPRHIIELGSTVEELEKLLQDLDYKVTDMDGNQVRPLELSEFLVIPR